MRHPVRIVSIGIFALSASFLAAAAVPRALAPAAGGLWEVSQNANGSGANRVCVPSPQMLAQFEHRNNRCTQEIVRDQGSEAVIRYSCAEGGFGQSRVTMLTPRSLRIETQGISGNLPFHYQLHARRIGNCPGR
ncbi:DUF3617 domain-containing protein [Sphingomonas xanthus]|uniref:DUF3617 family protein n=1 Tax=Sphingomonas xanthus TaxID=2594473 RepID=A0A516IT89_9SPHN|nr:DUF3617 family protein [Sphingomonas xanthus]QDP20138.1 DUF3617 family protein [Sphingomonas xanthus]